MRSTKGLILLFLIGLITCVPAEKKFEQKPGTDIQNVSPSENSILVLDTAIVAGFNGDTITYISNILQLIAHFDGASVNFPSDTFDVYDKTTEGCEIVVVHDTTTDYLKFYGTRYGEMGKKAFSFYAMNGRHLKFYCVSYTNILYNKPIYEEGSKTAETTTSYEIYFDNKLIAVLNEQKKKQIYSTAGMKKIENETRNFFNDYIGQIRLVK